MGAEWQEHNRVVADYDGTPVFADAIRRAMIAMCKAAGIDNITPHQLRHAFATRMVAANIHPKVTQALLGHSDPALTMRVYSHAPESEIRKAVEAASKVK